MLVNRGYFCKECEHEFEIYQSINEPLKKKCPQCKKNKLVQDLSGGKFHGSVKQYNTMGSIAERNSRELGSAGVQEKEQKIKESHEQMIKERNQKIVDAGYQVPERKEADPISSKVKKLVQGGDKKAIQKYIMEG